MFPKIEVKSDEIYTCDSLYNEVIKNQQVRDCGFFKVSEIEINFCSIASCCKNISSFAFASIANAIIPRRAKMIRSSV